MVRGIGCMDEVADIVFAADNVGVESSAAPRHTPSTPALAARCRAALNAARSV